MMRVVPGPWLLASSVLKACPPPLSLKPQPPPIPQTGRTMERPQQVSEEYSYLKEFNL